MKLVPFLLSLYVSVCLPTNSKFNKRLKNFRYFCAVSNKLFLFRLNAFWMPGNRLDGDFNADKKQIQLLQDILKQLSFFETSRK